MSRASGLVDEVLERLGSLARDVEAIVLFGSVAQGGKPSWASDLDAIVILRETCREEEVREARRRLASLCLLYTSPSPRDRG